MAETSIDPSTAYQARVEACVRHAIQNGLRNFETICRECEGAFPNVVFAALQEFDADIHSGLREQANQIESVIHRRFPHPHPADYEWRFTPGTVREISRHVHQFDGRIACLGVPTIYAELIDRQRDVYLIDRNPFLLKALGERANSRGFIADLTGKHLPPIGLFDVVIMDPPWYPTHMEAWLDSALKLLKKDAVLVTTLFPALTRPSALDERDQFIELLSSIGSVSILPLKVYYQTPLFEAETLESMGLPSMESWRVGELLEVQIASTVPPRPLSHPDEPTWHRFQFGPDIVAVRDNPDDTENVLHVGPIYAEGYYLLRSVSARDPVREKIDVWTSRNRCMSVSGRHRLLRALEQLQSGCAPNEVAQVLGMDGSERVALFSVLALIGW